MDLTIVTPSFRQLEQLSCCIASVADQEGVSVEHIVKDGGTKGFQDFSRKMAERWPNRPGYQRIMLSEPDGGMYDAINRGLRRATGGICAYLNCDEQYLPGTLKKVMEAFRENSDVDLFFGDALVLDEKGNARCWRKVLVPLVAHTWTCHFSAFTAAMFFRKKLFESGIEFDISYRAAADAAWYLEARRRGARAESLGILTSTFTETGTNLGLASVAREERERLNQSAPFHLRASRLFWAVFHRFRRWCAGGLKQRCLDYSIYLPSCLYRASFYKVRFAGLWPKRWKNI